MTSVGATMTKHATAALAEMDRLMTVCNSCRYCEGLCAVFPAMELRRTFSDGDLDYIANLCHACGACYIDCQFAPPHEYDVNLPRAIAVVRNDSYARYTWPAAMAPVFDRNGLLIAILFAVSVAAFLIAFADAEGVAALWSARHGQGAFYSLMSHNLMAAIFGIVFGYAFLAIALSVRRFWRASAAPAAAVTDIAVLCGAILDAVRLRYLDGGGADCHVSEAGQQDRRRQWHHATFFGFILCFAATSIATLYHYIFGREAPYPWWDVPVLLGTLGGLGLVAGPIGLLLERTKRDRVLSDPRRSGFDTAFLLMLLASGITGLALLVLRSTAAMPLVLALHLGVVAALFVAMPYGKFVHGLYRLASLLRYRYEMKLMRSQGPNGPG